jgi:hypothetical protein
MVDGLRLSARGGEMAGVGDGGGGGWENNASPGRRECAAAGPTRDRENPDVQRS